MLLCPSGKTTHLPHVTLSDISLPEEPPCSRMVDHARRGRCCGGACFGATMWSAGGGALPAAEVDCSVDEGDWASIGWPALSLIFNLRPETRGTGLNCPVRHPIG